MGGTGGPTHEEVEVAVTVQAHIIKGDPVIMVIIVTVVTIGTMGGGVVMDMEAMIEMGEGGGMEVQNVQRAR